MGIVALLLVIGLVMVYSASSVDAYNDYGDSAYFLKRQAVFVALGIICAAVVIALTPRIWSPNILLGIWIASVLMLALTMALGYVGLGAKRWISIGPFSFQPSEFAKIAMMLLAADLIVRYQNGDLEAKQLIVGLLVAILVPCAIIIMQPDLGTTIVALVSTLAVLWFGEVKRKWVIGFLVMVFIVGVVAIATMGFRSSRITAWLDPESDPYGSGYQSLNSYYAFANGGIFGVGLGNSTQKYEYLTYAYNDFIFAIIGEEGGIVGAVFVIVLYFLLAVFSFRIGSHANSRYGMIVCDSAAVTIVFQAFLNIACVCGVLPVTGKPLPLISYGGSSMLATMILVGIILSVSFKDSDGGVSLRRSSIRVRSRAGRSARS